MALAPAVLLPTVSFEIPNLCDDIHNCRIGAADTWPLVHVGVPAA